MSLLISFGLRDIMPARPVSDPLPLILAATGLTRGFLYLPWRLNTTDPRAERPPLPVELPPSSTWMLWPYCRLKRRPQPN
jgi:hypothetical protein